MSAVGFIWSDDQRAQVIPGATVVIAGSPNHDAGRYVVETVGVRFVFVKPAGGGPSLSVPWDRLDPESLNAPAQGDLFGGGL